MTRSSDSFAENWIKPFLVYTLIFVIYFNSIIAGSLVGYFGGWRADSGIYIWLTYEHIYKFFTWPSVGFDVGMFYPFGRVLGYSDNYLLPSFVSNIIYRLSGNMPLAYNTPLITALILNATVIHRLTNYLLKSKNLGWISGICLLFLPYFSFHRGHPQLQYAFFIPLVFFAVFKFCETRKARYASLIGFSVAGAFLSAVYYSIFCYFSAGVILLTYIILKRETIKRKDIYSLILANIPWLILIAFVAFPYRQVKQVLGEWPLVVAKAQSPTLLAYISAPSVAKFSGLLTSNLARLESHLFFSFTLLSLTLVSLFQIIKSNFFDTTANKKKFFILVGICLGLFLSYAFCLYIRRFEVIKTYSISLFFWILIISFLIKIFNLGKNNKDPHISYDELGVLLGFLVVFFLFSSLGIIGAPTCRIPFPEIFKMIHHLPGFDALRGISRFGILAIISSCLLSCWGLYGYFIQQEGISSKRKSLTILGLCCIIFFELRTRDEVTVKPVPTPKIYESLANLKDDNGAVLSLPIGNLAGPSGGLAMMRNTYYMNWTHPYGHPIVNGYSGKVPLFFQVQSEVFDKFPSVGALTRIGQYVGIKYIVRNYDSFSRDFRKIDITPVSDQVTQIECDKRRNCLYEIHPIVDLSLIQDKRIYFPPNTHHKREVSLEVLSNHEDTVKFFMRDKHSEIVTLKEVKITDSSEWSVVSFTLPKSGNSVIPHWVEIYYSHSTSSEWVKLRNISYN